jgi:hypothetical protein
MGVSEGSARVTAALVEFSPRGYRALPMEPPMRVSLFPILLVLALGCPEGEKDSEDTGPGGGGTDTADIDLGPPGCINLNGEEGDFLTITDALKYAGDGDTVQVCAGEYSEKVTLVKAVAVVGEGSGVTAIDAPVNEPAFDIAANGASVSGFTITSTRSGVTVDSSADVSLSDLVLDAPANYGIEAAESTNLSISGCTFSLPAYGGVFLSGGSAVVDSSNFDHPVSYGIWSADGNVLSATNNVFTGVTATADDGSDGHAIFADGSTVSTMQNQVVADDLFGFWVQDGTLAMDGDVITDTPYAVLAFDSVFTAANTSIYGAQVQGIYASSKSTAVSISNTSVELNGGATTGLTSCSVDYTSFAGWCGGILVSAPEFALSGVSIADYENYGLYTVPYKSNGEQILSITDTSLDNNGRWSLFASNVTATIDGLSVTGHREPDTANTQPCYGYVDQGTSAVFEISDVTMTNSTILESEGWGLSVVRGTLDLSASNIGAVACSGIIGYESSLLVSDNTFGYGTYYGALFNYTGALLLDGNRFVDTDTTDESIYEDASNPGAYYRYEYPHSGRDVTSTYATACAITNNTFTGGAQSLDIEVSGCTISGNSWSDYNGALVQVYQGSPSDPVVVVDNSADDFGGPAVYSLYGYAEVEDFRVGNTRAYEYGYAAWYVAADGTETLQYSYTGSYGNPVFESYGYYYGSWSDTDGDGVADTFTEYGYPSGLTLSNVTVGSAYSSLVEGSEAELELTDVTAESVGGYGIYAYWNHYAPQVEVDGVSIGSTTYAGVQLSANTADAGYALLSDISIDVAGGTGLYLTGFAEWSVSDVTLLDVGGYGLYANGSYSYYDYATSTSVSGTYSPVGSVEDFLVSSASDVGLALTDGSVLIEGTSVSGGNASGVTLSSLSAWVEDNAFINNAGFGMSCSNVTFEFCGSTDLSGNTSGEHNGCSDDCVAF